MGVFLYKMHSETRILSNNVLWGRENPAFSPEFFAVFPCLTEFSTIGKMFQ